MRLPLFILAGAILSLWLTEAWAQVPCGDTATMQKNLRDKYSEEPRAQGVMDSGNVLQFFSSPDGESWTVVVMRPDGSSCPFFAGHNWMRVLPPKPEGVEG